MSTQTMGSESVADGGAVEDVQEEPTNDVRLRGRVSSDAETRVLPSGDEIVVVRVIVPRTTTPARSDGKRSATVDVIDCVAWTSRTRRSMRSWRADDEVAVSGQLRRRFFRAGGQTASRMEVEVSGVRMVRRHARSG